MIPPMNCTPEGIVKLWGKGGKLHGCVRHLSRVRGLLKSCYVTPRPASLRGYDHTPFKSEFFHITKAPAGSKVPPHSVTDDLNETAVVLIIGRLGLGCPCGNLAIPCGITQVDKAFVSGFSGGIQGWE